MRPTTLPPRAVGGPSVVGLPNALLSGAEHGHDSDLLDIADLAIAQLALRKRLIRKRRMNPLYWIDRLLRAILGLPSYLAALMFGQEPEQFRKRRIAGPINVVTDVAVAAGTVYIAWFKMC